MGRRQIPLLPQAAFGVLSQRAPHHPATLLPACFFGMRPPCWPGGRHRMKNALVAGECRRHTAAAGRRSPGRRRTPRPAAPCASCRPASRPPGRRSSRRGRARRPAPGTYRSPRAGRRFPRRRPGALEICSAIEDEAGPAAGGPWEVGSAGLDPIAGFLCRIVHLRGDLALELLHAPLRRGSRRLRAGLLKVRRRRFRHGRLGRDIGRRRWRCRIANVLPPKRRGEPSPWVAARPQASMAGPCHRRAPPRIRPSPV